MEFFTSAVSTLSTIVVALGAGMCVWGGVNLMEGYGNDNPGARSQGMKQLIAGGAIALIGTTLVPMLSSTLTAAVYLPTIDLLPYISVSRMVASASRIAAGIALVAA